MRAEMKKDDRVNNGNPVAKNMEKFNRPATHVDRKKRSKSGYTKHKNSPP